ncbi:hypothetical protein IWX47DRAFT_883044 [Phyllosticta citricarpa]
MLLLPASGQCTRTRTTSLASYLLPVLPVASPAVIGPFRRQPPTFRPILAVSQSTFCRRSSIVTTGRASCHVLLLLLALALHSTGVVWPCKTTPLR